jgi:hypothetical protein
MLALPAHPSWLCLHLPDSYLQQVQSSAAVSCCCSHQPDPTAAPWSSKAGCLPAQLCSPPTSCDQPLLGQRRCKHGFCCYGTACQAAWMPADVAVGASVVCGWCNTPSTLCLSVSLFLAVSLFLCLGHVAGLVSRLCLEIALCAALFLHPTPSG